MESYYEKIILGCGFAGLIASLYHKDALVVEAANKVAIDFLDETFPKYLHNNKSTRRLCTDIGTQEVCKNFNIKIYHDNKVYDFYDDLPNKNEIYKDYCTKKYGYIPDNKMNGFLSDDKSDSFIENKEEIINKIYELRKNKILLDSRVEKIDIANNEITLANKKIKYRHLISTIPINIFAKLSDIPIVNDPIKVYVAIAKLREKSNLDFDFAYVADNKYDFHRINFNKNKDIVTFEMINENKLEDCVNFCINNNLYIKDISLKTFLFPFLRHKLEIDNVHFIGRFSTGDYSAKIERIIDEARQAI